MIFLLFASSSVPLKLLETTKSGVFKTASKAIAQDYLARTKELILWVRQDPRLQTS